MQEEEQGPSGARNSISTSPDLSGAYNPATGHPLLAHQLWLGALSLQGTLLTQLPSSADVAQSAVTLVAGGEQRLLLALEPPAASPQQPLTLALLQVWPHFLSCCTPAWLSLLLDSPPC